MSKVAVIYGSSRPSQVGKRVAQWFANEASAEGVELEMVDLAEVNLPLINEAMPPMMGQYGADSTKAWAEQIAGYDGFIVLTAEYNGSVTPILKNALDTIYAEWNDKPFGIVSYGAGPKSRSAAHLKDIVGALRGTVVEPTAHVGKSHETVTDEGVDAEAVVGSAQEVLDAVAAAL